MSWPRAVRGSSRRSSNGEIRYGSRSRTRRRCPRRGDATIRKGRSTRHRQGANPSGGTSARRAARTDRRDAGDVIGHVGWYRDAISRAMMTSSSDDLLGLQETALTIDDRLLARATMVVGMRRGHAHVVDGWTAANKAYEADADRLFRLSHSGATSIRDAVAFEMAFIETDT
jgi:hypothetical protein